MFEELEAGEGGLRLFIEQAPAAMVMSIEHALSGAQSALDA